MVRHNHAIANGHFHKDWQHYVRTNFSQPFVKRRRRLQRDRKTLLAFPAPLGKLRPLVICPTVRYNSKPPRLGRGFSVRELKAAGLSARYAQTVGIAVDYRRRNGSLEGIRRNEERLKEYLARLVKLPKRVDIDKMVLVKRQERKRKGGVGELVEEIREVTEEEKKVRVYEVLRVARSESRYLNRRRLRKLQKAETTL